MTYKHILTYYNFKINIFYQTPSEKLILRSSVLRNDIAEHRNRSK